MRSDSLVRADVQQVQTNKKTVLKGVGDLYPDSFLLPKIKKGNKKNEKEK